MIKSQFKDNKIEIRTKNFNLTLSINDGADAHKADLIEAIDAIGKAAGAICATEACVMLDGEYSPMEIFAQINADLEVIRGNVMNSFKQIALEKCKE